MLASFSIISKRKTAGDPFFHLAQDPKSARFHLNIILGQYDKMDVNRTLTNMIHREMIAQCNIRQIVLLMCIQWMQNSLYKEGPKI